MEEKLRQFALSANGTYTHIDSVRKGENYFCLSCNTEVIAKRGNIRQHHFAHKPDSELGDTERIIVSDCLKSNETYLHNAFKTGLYQILKDKIEKHEEFIIRWNPSNIGEQKKDLLRTAKSIAIEKYVEELKPDLTLYNGAGKAYVAIEIVVDNKPSRKKLAYYSEENITLYEIDLDRNNLEVLNNISEIASHPTIFSFVPAPEKYPDIPEKRICEKCGKTASFSYMNIVTTKCFYCKTANRSAYRTLINKNGKSIRYSFDKSTTISEKIAFDIHGLLYDKNKYDFLCENEDCKKPIKISPAKEQKVSVYPLGYFCQQCGGKIKEGVVYNGQKFQNRAEAKWAEFFDNRNIKYEYNPKEYRFSDLNPFPVFYLKDSKQLFRANRYIHYEEKDKAKLYSIASKTGLDTIIGFENGNFYVIDIEYGISYDDDCFFVQCYNCKKYYFTTSTGDWTCNHCQYYNGDGTHRLIGTGDECVFDFE